MLENKRVQKPREFWISPAYFRASPVFAVILKITSLTYLKLKFWMILEKTIWYYITQLSLASYSFISLMKFDIKALVKLIPFWNVHIKQVYALKNWVEGLSDEAFYPWESQKKIWLKSVNYICHQQKKDSIHR